MRRLRDNQYFHLGMMILTLITISIILLAIVLNFSSFLAVVKTILGPFRRSSAAQCSPTSSTR